MGTEIERKFLLAGDGWRAMAHGHRRMVQGYLANTERGSIRVRLAGDDATLNIKSMTLGVTRQEYTYEIPVADAELMLRELCLRPLIEKVRHYVEFGGLTFEIDEFEGDNAGLVVAELELQHADQPFTRPDWLGDEVSDDPRYYNVCLVDKPFNRW
jgi:adenylate cyclase